MLVAVAVGVAVLLVAPVEVAVGVCVGVGVAAASSVIVHVPFCSQPSTMPPSSLHFRYMFLAPTNGALNRIAHRTVTVVPSRSTSVCAHSTVPWLFSIT